VYFFSFYRSDPKIVSFNDGEQVEVASAVIHPKNDEFHNDLVLVKLERKIK
jgi:hypothetical protein